MKIEKNLITQEDLNAMMKLFVKLKKTDKKEQIIETIKKMIAYNIRTAKKYNTDFNFTPNREMIDIINKNDSTEDDFYEALYAYLIVLQNTNTNIVNALIKNEINKI